MKKTNNKISEKLNNSPSGTPAYKDYQNNPDIITCPSCGEKVLKRKGFRVSAMSCTKCGSKLSK